MDFFGHQEAARRRTALLVAYFALAVLLITGAIYLAAVLALFVERGDGRPFTAATLWDPGLLVLVAMATLAVVIGGSLYKINALRRGGPSVAEALGATPVASDTGDLLERRLLNVVAEMAIASGTPVPGVYVLRDEQGINAFAAGYATGDAVVAVTRGALETLSRDGLQGVIAHEFSHILNGDMRLNIRLMGVLHGILIIALLGQGLLRSARFSGRRAGRGRGRGMAVVLLFALALFVVGYVGLFFAKLIKAAVSRQREFLADAAAVQFTRNPDGIAGALKAIGARLTGSTLAAPRAETASHLYFANGLSAPFTALLATHPPLTERIRRLDPDWDGRYRSVPVAPPASSAGTAGIAPVAAVPEGAAHDPATAEPSMALTPEDAVARAGVPTPAHMAYAAGLLSALPPLVVETARDPYGARAQIYALLISPDQTARRHQVAWLEGHADPGVLRVFRTIQPVVAGLSRDAYLPLVDLSLPALRRLSNGQYRTFRENLDRLVAADRRLAAFELALLRVVQRHLDRHFADAAPAAGHLTAQRLGSACGALLSALAQIGHADAGAADAAFRAGVSRLDLAQAPAFTPDGAADLSTLGAVLDRLARLGPLEKRKLIAACTVTIARDGRMTVEEAEILRAVSDSLEVPMPPFLPPRAQASADRPKDQADAASGDRRAAGPWG